MKDYVRLVMLLSLSIVLSIVESFIPLFNGMIPGVKLGLANIIVLMVLYKYKVKDVYFVSILRVIIVGVLRTGLFSINFFFSLSGAFFSATSMIIFKKTKLSMVGVSIIGSIFHSLGQILMAVFILNNNKMLYYLPWIILFSIPTGIFVGIVSKKLLVELEDNINF
ncbi:MAG: Gx transporter family protein [Bacilli bacterium]|nr:Gx transporter family protein [Bacilli bacterium]